MINDKRGVAVFVYFMLGVIFFLLGLALAPALSDTINSDTVRGSDGLNCSNSSISNQDKAICTQVDSIPPLWIGVMFGFAAIILGRILL